MNLIQIIIATLLLLFGAYVAIMNWGCVIVNMMNKRKGIDRHHSTVPLITLVSTGLAYMIYPLHPKEWIGLIPLVDIGNWTLVIGLPIAIARGAFKK
jgi:hypothetical protein